MNLKIAFCVGMTCALWTPLLAATQTEVGVKFMIDSPQVFPDQTLGESKPEIEMEMSRLIAERLEFYFPFLDWKVGGNTDNQILVKLIDQDTGICNRQADLVVRAFRSGTEIEMVDVPATPLYNLCDPFIPNRKASGRNALNTDDYNALLQKLQQAIENTVPSSGEPAGLLNNNTIRDAIHHEFLGTIPMTLTYELRDQPDGTGKYLYLPVSFDDLKSSTNDPSCENPESDCSRLRLTLNLENSPPASFTLRVAGFCGDQVLCEVLSGGVPGGFEISQRTYWEDGLENLLNQAQSLSFTMVGFRKNSLPCSFLEP